MQNKSRMKLIIFFDVPIYLYVNTLKNTRRFGTYSLIIDGNGIKQSRLIFWKEVMVSLSKMAKHQLISISALVLGGERNFFFFFFSECWVLCSVFKPALMRTPEGYVPPFPK